MRYLFSPFFLACSILFFASVPAHYAAGRHLPSVHRSFTADSSQRNALRERIVSHPVFRRLYSSLYALTATTESTQIGRSRIAKAAGFVLYADRDSVGIPLSPEEKTRLQATVLASLREMDTAVQSSATQYQWRAVELMQFALAYDFMVAAGYPEDARSVERLNAFAGAASRELGKGFISRNNLTIKLASALGTAALVLRKSPHASPTQNETRVQQALDFIENALWNFQSRDDRTAGYSEGPYYFRYAMISALPFWLMLDQTAEGSVLRLNGRSYPNPLNQESHRRLFQWMALLRQPDGRLPAFEDTYMDAYFPELATIAEATGLPECAWPNENAGNPFSPEDYDRTLADNYDFRAEYILATPDSLAPPIEAPTMAVMPDAGYSVFRSSWQPDALYLALIGKNGRARTAESPTGSGHKHANETAFILQYGGKLLAGEPGYYQYDYRDSLIYSPNHNILLVDGKGPDATGFESFLFGSDTFIEDTLTSEHVGRTSLRTSYQEADIVRTGYFFDRNLVVLVDSASSAMPRRFTHQIHGFGLLENGSYTPDFANSRAEWNVDDVLLRSCVSSVDEPVAFETVRRKHAPTYRQFAEHDVLYSSITGKKARFLTVLAPSFSATPTNLEPLASPEGTAAISFASTDGKGLAFIAPNSSASHSLSTVFGDLRSDAHVLILRWKSSSSYTLYTEHATFVELDGRRLFEAALPLRVSLTTEGKHVSLTSTSDVATSLTLRVSKEPETIAGTGYSSAVLVNNRWTVSFEARADVELRLSDRPVSVAQPAEATAFEISGLWPNPVRSAQSASLGYRLNEAARVRITVTDVLGREAAMVQDEWQAPGGYTVSIPTQALVPGSYFLRIAANGAVQSRMLQVR